MPRWTLPSRAKPERAILSDSWTTSTCYKAREIERAVLHAAIFQLGKDREPEFCPLACAEPQPQEFLLPVYGDTEREVDGFRLHRPLLARFDEQGIKVQDRIHRGERPRLPGAHVLQHRVCDGRDERRRHLRPVQLFQMPLNLPR